MQNWYPGDREGRGGIYNFVTKRGICRENARLSWTQVETGSAITWKYPSCILAGDNSVGEFYSVAMTNNFQQADTGTKMIHIGRNTRSRIVSKGISAGRSENSYRGLVRMAKGAENARNYSQCDSLLIGDKCGAHTFPVIDSRNRTAVVEHEATTSKISDDQLFYCNQRGLSTEDAVGLIVNAMPARCWPNCHGIRCRGAETAFDQPRRLGRITDVEDESAGAQRQSAAQRSGFADAGTYCRQSAGDVRRRAYFVHDLTVRPCTGCMSCRSKLRCALPEDDAHRVAEAIRTADALVIGSPCYWGNMNGALKVLFDRSVHVMMGEKESGMPVALHKGQRAVLGGDVQHDISVQRVVQPDPRGVPRPARDTPVERLPHRRYRGQKRLPQERQADGQRD